jgi:lysozyme family protein
MQIMVSNWDNAFKLMLKSEGGFVNHPSDPGGMTNLGVTKATWENWVGRESDEAEMRGLTPEKVEPLYKKKYFDAVRGDELPVGLDYLMFDFAVNAGAGRAIKTLQTAVGVTPDGGFGPMTMAAVQTVDPVELIERFSQAKEDFYRSLTTFATFGKGWLNRVADVKVKASSMLA